MTTDKIAALKRTPVFGSLGEPELRALADRAIELKLGRGEILFMEGDEARGLYVIVEGSVRAFRESVEGREQVIHVETAGTTFAEVPVFDGGRYPSTVAGEGDSVLLFIDKRDVRRLCLEHPPIALAALALLATRLRKCASLVEDLALHEVDRRLAKFLYTEARSRGGRSAGGVTFEMPLTNQQVAARIGSVREVVSRALARLQKSGLITIEGRQITIPDEEALRSYCASETV
ncbi:MAG TPA: Crp/Fnr family transcriptional regulator [Blastocatellia bacterium]|nr:Crp/Fnr family transcriptional regulator [Blastocatellia bacterium]